MLDTEKFTYTVDMFRDTLHLPVETPENPFVAPVNIQTIEAFMNRVGYQGVVDKVSAFYTKNLAQPWQTMFKKKEAIQYPRFIKLIIADLMKKFPNIPQRIQEDYHSIKDDIPLISVYTTRNVLVRGMLIPYAFLTEEIRATDDFKEYETVFINVVVPMNQPQPVVSTQGTHRSTPRAHRTPTLTASPQGKKRKQSVGESTKVQEKLAEEEIKKMVEGEEDEESYASEFVDSIFNDDVDDSERNEDKEIEKETNIDDVEKTDEVVNEKDIVDDVTGSMEIRKEQKQTPIPSPTKSPKNVSFSNKTGTKELTATIREVLDHCNKVVPKMTFAKTNEMIKQEMPHLVNLAVNKDREVNPINAQEMIAKEFATHGPKMIEELFRKHMQNTTLNLYPTTSSSTADI
ncbi:hypothetical protein Tco_0103831 [Tanacetum coccineum]